MAKVTVTRCAGGNHIHMTVQEAWGTHVIHGEAKDLLASARRRSDSDLLEDIRKTIRDASATTPAQMKAAIEAATFTDTTNDLSARDV